MSGAALPTAVQGCFRWRDGGGRWSRPCRIYWEAARSAGGAAAAQAVARNPPAAPPPRQARAQPEPAVAPSRPAWVPERRHLVRAGPTLPPRAEHDGPAGAPRSAPRSGVIRAARPARAPRRDAESTRSRRWRAATRPAPPCVRAPAGPHGRWHRRGWRCRRGSSRRGPSGTGGVRRARFRRGRYQHGRYRRAKHRPWAGYRHGRRNWRRRTARRHCLAAELARPGAAARKQGAWRRRTPVTLLALDRAQRAGTAGNPAKPCTTRRNSWTAAASPTRRKPPTMATIPEIRSAAPNMVSGSARRMRS